MVARIQILLGHDHRKFLLLGEGIHGGGVLVAVQIDGLRFLGEHHRHIAEMLGGHACDANAGRFDGQNFGDVLAGEMLGPRGSHTVEQTYVALVVQERVHLEHVTCLYRSLALDSFLKFLHRTSCHRVPQPIWMIWISESVRCPMRERHVGGSSPSDTVGRRNVIRL